MRIMDITIEEREILTDMIESGISDLHSEIRDTGRLDYKVMLRRRKEILKKILEALKEPAPVPQQVVPGV